MRYFTQPGIDVQVQRRTPQRPQSAYIERDLVRTASVHSQVRTSLGAVPNRTDTQSRPRPGHPVVRATAG